MGIRFACHECGKRLNIKEDLAGRRGVCPACAAKIRIPLTDAETSTAVESTRQLAGPVEPFHVSCEGATPRPDEASEAASIAPSEADGGDGRDGEDGEATWYVRPPSGNQYGPASTELLSQWVAEGRVAENSLVWRDGWPNWRSASEALPEYVGRLASHRDVETVSFPGPAVAAPSAAIESSDAIQTVAISEPAVAVDRGTQLSGAAGVGVTRRARTSRRVLVIGVLSAVAVMLVGVLLIVANLG
jgi:hypothetical protein